jgi:DNA-binding GntR family transcriptional regulator
MDADAYAVTGVRSFQAVIGTSREGLSVVRPDAASEGDDGAGDAGSPGGPSRLGAYGPASLDRASPVPLYFQIAQVVEAAIGSGAYRAGQLLDTELQLAERFGVSRPTVRQAIQQLVQQGLVVRRRGVGSLVVTQRIERPVALTSLYDDLAASGCAPTTKLLAMHETGADVEVATALGLEVGDPVQSVERLRFANGEPLAVMRNYLPVDLVPAQVVRRELAVRGLYELLREYGIVLHAADQVIGARKPTASEARLLGTSRSATLLTMARTAFDRTGRAVEHGRHAYLADQYAFKMRLVVS